MKRKTKILRNRMTLWSLMLALLLTAALPDIAKAAELQGLQEVDGVYYYFVKPGVPVKKQFQTIQKKIYYFKANGAAAAGWKKIKGKKYYFSEKGAAAVGLKQIGQDQYYFDEKGVMQTGWQKLGKRIAYFQKKTGKMVKNKVVDGVKIKKNGYAKLTSVQKKQLKAEEKAREIAKKITNSSMSASQKLRACWNYMVSRQNFHYVRKEFSAYKGWEYDYAYQMLTGRGGNCYNFACAFAMLAKAVGYKPYVLRGMVPHTGGGMTPHCMVKINGHYYDPEAQWAGWAPGIYGNTVYPMTWSQSGSKKV